MVEINNALSEQLNILFLPKWYPNEFDEFDGNFIENYSKALSNSVKLSVLFVHSESKNDNQYRLVNRSTAAYEEIHVFFKKASSSIAWWNKLITGLRYRKAQKIAYKALSTSRFDLCHVHVLSRSALLALNLKRKFRTPYVISEHWSGYHAHVNEYKGSLKKTFTAYVVNHSNGIHAVSTPLKLSMEKHQLLGDYTIIPNVVDTKLFQPKERNNAKKEILFVGNLLQRPKRILDIIRSMAALAKQRNDFNLSIYGEGNEESACEALIKELQLKAIVELKGTKTRAEIATIMAESDFLILFSEFENQPCVINEAQACGIPVVVPDIEGIVERMNEQLGIVFKKNNVEAFEDAVLTMLDKHKSYDQQYIRDFAVNAYSEESIAHQFDQFYRKALANKK